MSKVAIVTDSNSGITQKFGEEYGVFVLPMPFYVNGELHFEDIDLTTEQFFEALEKDAEISTSQPAIGDVLDMWNKVLEEYDEIVHIPMSSGLSGSCDTAMMLAQEYEGKVYVVDNQRISVTQKLSVLEAKAMADQGKSAAEIVQVLMDTKMDSTIYITLETLKYLKKGGRITPAAAALGTILKIKPVLQIQGEKLDAFAKVRSVKSAKKTMIEAIQKDCSTRFGSDESLDNIVLMMAYTGEESGIKEFQDEVKQMYPNHTIMADHLSLSVSCHIGAGAIAIAASKKIDGIDYSKIF